MASTEIRGNDANKAPINEFRFDISEIATIRKLVIINLLEGVYHFLLAYFQAILLLFKM